MEITPQLESPNEVTLEAHVECYVWKGGPDSDKETIHPMQQMYSDGVNEEDAHAAFHHLYIQRNGIEFLTPILFEDGMDYVECEMYYASLRSQENGGTLRPLQGRNDRRPTVDEFKAIDLDYPRSILRKKSVNTREKCRRRPQRRVSYSGMPIMLDGSPLLVRSNSQRGLHDQERSRPRVAFEEYVQVVTIHPVRDYPIDCRSQMWMSREEMVMSVRRNLAEDLLEKRQRLKEQQIAMSQQLDLIDDKPVSSSARPCVERRVSADSVIDECFYAVSAPTHVH